MCFYNSHLENINLRYRNPCLSMKWQSGYNYVKLSIESVSFSKNWFYIGTH